MTTISDFLRTIDEDIDRLAGAMSRHQCEDGGFKGFYCHDTVSGIWSTAEIVHTASKVKDRRELPWLAKGCGYLVKHQNPDGGWPFRAGGKSVTDVTAWCCLAASHFGWSDSVRNGITFILAARINEGSNKEQGWGLTTFEDDRVYSTWIACYCLSRLLRIVPEAEAETIAAIGQALGESVDWLVETRQQDGGWGPTRGAAPRFTSTAVALLTLFMLGKDPAQFVSSWEYLQRGMADGLWEPEDEVVVTREGYELTQKWFTSTLCFRAMIFFAEMSLVPIEQIDDTFKKLSGLIQSDGDVRLSTSSSADMVWTIPFMMDALHKYKRFVTSKEDEYKRFLARRQERLFKRRRQQVEELLQRQFPYPISHVFFSFQHELDHHRKFQIGLQIYEVVMKYAAIVGLSGCLALKDSIPELNALLANRFLRPSLGDWAALLEVLLKHSEGFRKLLAPTVADDVLASRRSGLDDSSPKTNLHEAMASAIALRNENAGHGAIKTLYEYKQMVEEEEGRLLALIQRMSFLASSNSFLVLAAEYDEFGEGDRYKVRVFKGMSIQDDALETSSRLSEGQKDTMVRYIYFQNAANGMIVNLYPFISYMFCDECKHEQFFFYNGTKSGARVLYLSYGCGHSAERDNWSHFQKRLGPTVVLNA